MVGEIISIDQAYITSSSNSFRLLGNITKLDIQGSTFMLVYKSASIKVSTSLLGSFEDKGMCWVIGEMEDGKVKARVVRGCNGLDTRLYDLLLDRIKA